MSKKRPISIFYEGDKPCSSFGGEKNIWIVKAFEQQLKERKENSFPSEGSVEEFWKTFRLRNERWVDRNILQLEREDWNNEDEILTNYKFTNSYRELDRNSQWEIKNIILNKKNKTMREIAFQIFYFRLFNNPQHFDYLTEIAVSFSGTTDNGIPTYTDFTSEESIKEFSAILLAELKNMRKRDINPFTNAYLTNSGKEPRDETYANHVIPNVIRLFLKDELFNTSDPYQFIDNLLSIDKVGDFVAHEVYISMCYINKYRNDLAEKFKFDELMFTNVGPGAKVGLQNVFFSEGKDCSQYMNFCKDFGVHKDTGIYFLFHDLLNNFEKYGMNEFQFVHYNFEQRKYEVKKGFEGFNLTLHNIEFWLCEYQKYRKMKTGNGKQRSRWEPRPSISL